MTDLQRELLAKIADGSRGLMELQWLVKHHGLRIPELETELKALMRAGLIELRDMGQPLKRFVITEKGRILGRE